MTGDREPPPVLRRDPAYRRAASVPPRPRSPVPPPRPVRAHRRRRRWTRWLTTALLLGVLTVTAGVVGGGGWLDSHLHRTAVFGAYPDRPARGSGTTWLLVGSDSRQDLSADQQQQLSTGADLGAGRTDTLLLVHVPGFGSTVPATVVSIPRDSYVPIPGYGHDKINTAYAVGGAALLAQTVEQATGLRLDHYAEIGFAGFATLVDALGGVTLCPAEPIDDPLAGLHLPAGCHLLDGPAALGYVRSRATPRADLDRMAHQRLFMSALLDRAASPTVWLNPWRWYAVPRAAADAVTVDRGDHVWDLARLGWALRGAPVTMTVPIGEFTGSDAGAVVVWDHQAAGQLFEALRRDTPVPPAALTDQQS